jgi:hypothetical protein
MAFGKGGKAAGSKKIPRSLKQAMEKNIAN